MMSIDNTFFSFRYLEQIGDKFKISSKSTISSDTEKYALKYLKETVNNFCDEGVEFNISLILGIPSYMREKIGNKFRDDDESYAIIISSESKSVELFAESHRGLIYAVSTLKQLSECGEISDMLLYDYPDKKVRGYRVYTPGRDYFTQFKKMIDMLVYYKYNALMIEVGGAMEYKKHPIINERWVQFCKEVSVDPEAAHKIQLYTYPWAKDSIHFDNGNGGYITQDEMRDLIAYCNEREIDVYPEVPSLSHSDYIVMAYPELNERVEDKHPDTYCPSNPKTYEVLFDIIDEVVDVFNPKYINIGHDEYYTSAKCDKCKHKNPVDIYVDDIIKINNYLKTKNITAIMWGEKMYSGIVGYLDEDNPMAPLAGDAWPEKDIPALHECKGKIPNDVIIFNWCWQHPDFSVEESIADLGYKMLYGNYMAISHDEYRKRTVLTDGGFVSNWGSVEEQYMQRNMQNFNLITTAYIFWNGEYDTSDRAKLVQKAKDELYSRYKKTLGEDIIELEHTTDYSAEYKVFFDGVFIVEKDWHLGNYVLTYQDGSQVLLPVVYGYNIRKSDPGCTKEEYAATVSYENMEAIGASYPYFEDGKIIYKTAYKNPYPEKLLSSIQYESVNGANVELIKNPVQLI